MPTRLHASVASILHLTAGCDAATESTKRDDAPTAATTAKSGDPTAADTKFGATKTPSPGPAPEAPEPEPKRARSFDVALRSGVVLSPFRTVDGAILVHAGGKMARVEAGKLVDVPHSGPTKAMEDRTILLDHFGGRWPDAIFSCWTAGMPNDPGQPLLLRFQPGEGWKKITNGGGDNRWCYEGFAATSSGALLSRKIAHDFEEERFALGPFVTPGRKPGFTVIDGTAEAANPELSFVADWALGKDDEIWAVTGPELVRLAPGKPHEAFALPEPVARRSGEPLRVTHAAGTTYVHGKSRDGAYLARWREGTLEPIDLPEEITREHPPDVYVPPIHIADVQAADNGDLWLLAGRISWAGIDDGDLWRRTSEGWERVDALDPDELDPEADPRLAEHESVTGFVLDGAHLWVGVRSFRYGAATEGVLLTTMPVDGELAWTLPP
jgi:hypothetical protein